MKEDGAGDDADDAPEPEAEPGAVGVEEALTVEPNGVVDAGELERRKAETTSGRYR